MRRVTLMLAAMAVMVALFAAVAYAATIEGVSQSSSQREHLQESNLNDTFFGRGGPDFIDANDFANDTDVANGNGGNDDMSVRDGDDRDTANGGRGVDTCFGDAGDELNCEVLNPDL